MYQVRSQGNLLVCLHRRSRGVIPVIKDMLCEETCLSTHLPISLSNIYSSLARHLMSLPWPPEMSVAAVLSGQGALAHFYALSSAYITNSCCSIGSPYRVVHSPTAKNKTLMSGTVHIPFHPREVTNQSKWNLSP